MLAFIAVRRFNMENKCSNGRWQDGNWMCYCISVTSPMNVLPRSGVVMLLLLLNQHWLQTSKLIFFNWYNNFHFLRWTDIFKNFPYSPLCCLLLVRSVPLFRVNNCIHWTKSGGLLFGNFWEKFCSLINNLKLVWRKFNFKFYKASSAIEISDFE